MLLNSSRWLLVAAFLVSSALWLGVSSIFANAVHIFWKSNYSWAGFGSVSIWTIVVALGWLLIVGYVLQAESWITTKNMTLSICIVAIWIVLLAVLTAWGYEMLVELGAAAILVWVIEFVVALLLVNYFARMSLPFFGIQNSAVFVTVTLTWLMAAKVMLLCLSPGVTLRL